MEGRGEISPASTVGTLEYTVANDPNGDYQFLVDTAANWTVRDDVWMHYERGAAQLLTGSLTVGYGASSTTIGPELGFGYVMGDCFDDQTLTAKAAWGGKSLAADSRPPSSYGPTGFCYRGVLVAVGIPVTQGPRTDPYVNS